MFVLSNNNVLDSNTVAFLDRHTILLDRLIYSLQSINGAYSFLLMTKNSLIGVRDPYGIRPLVLGKLGDSYVLSSESCGLDIIGAQLIRDVEPGEILIIQNILKLIELLFKMIN